MAGRGWSGRVEDTPLHRRCAPAQTRHGAVAVLGGAASANPWGGLRHWAAAYPGQDEPDWSLRKPSLHALSEPGGRHAELQHMEYERRVQLGEDTRLRLDPRFLGGPRLPSRSP